jgi:hypothetical protein
MALDIIHELVDYAYSKYLGIIVMFEKSFIAAEKGIYYIISYLGNLGCQEKKLK